MPPEHPQPARAVEGFCTMYELHDRLDVCEWYPKKCNPALHHLTKVTVLEGHRAAALEELVAAAERYRAARRAYDKVAHFDGDHKWEEAEELGVAEEAVDAALRRWKGG